MYGAIWRVLPGPTPVRALIAALLALAVAAVLFLWVFPWAEQHLPFLDVTVDQPGSATSCREVGQRPHRAALPRPVCECGDSTARCSRCRRGAGYPPGGGPSAYRVGMDRFTWTAEGLATPSDAAVLEALARVLSSSVVCRAARTSAFPRVRRRRDRGRSLRASQRRGRSVDEPWMSHRRTTRDSTRRGGSGPRGSAGLCRRTTPGKGCTTRDGPGRGSSLRRGGEVVRHEAGVRDWWSVPHLGLWVRLVSSGGLAALEADQGDARTHEGQGKGRECGRLLGAGVRQLSGGALRLRRVLGLGGGLRA